MFLILALWTGIFTKMHRWTRKYKWASKWAGKGEKFLELDKDIRQFYTASPRRLILSSLYNLAAWSIGVFETYVAAKILGIPMTLEQAWLIEALIQVIRIVTFFIPASIGAQEGGIVFLFAEFGFGNPASATFAVLRRIREIVWMGFGLLLWALNLKSPVVDNTL
jgi:glycosyltransferase 2 family protein